MRHKFILLVIILFVLALAKCTCGKMTNEIHYIPKHFIGQVIINFKMKDGIRKEYRNGARVYRIPYNGILDTRFGSNAGWAEHENTFTFVYYDTVSGQNQILTRIDWYSDQEISRMDSLQIVVKQLGYRKRYNDDRKQIESFTYFVDTLKNFKHYRPD